MKKRVLAAIVIAMSLLTAGCGDDASEASSPSAVQLDPQPVVSATPTPTPTPEATEEPEPESQVITERVKKDGKIQSYLTGEWVDEAIGTRRPIAVSIPNQKSCLPHYGITNASVIYEIPLRDNLTRLLGIFEDFDDLDRIGPTRSIRDYMIYIGLEHDAIICHWGSAIPYANPLLNDEVKEGDQILQVDNISQATTGINNPVSGAYDRYNRSGSYNSTDSAYLFVNGLKKGVETRGYDWDYGDDFEPKFLFAAEGVRAEYEDAKSATKIWPDAGKGNYNTVGAYFEYNEATGKYDCYEYSSKLLDERNGQTLQVDNVVLQVVYGEERDDHGYLILEEHGSPDLAAAGACNGDFKLYFFTNGKVVEGYWERVDGSNKPAKYYDADGNELVFNQGKTFVCQIWSKWENNIKYE